MKKYSFEFCVVFILIAATIFGSIGAFATDTQQHLAENLIRLHVIANSDSDEDQAVKLKVRDAVLWHISEITKNCKTKADAEKIISDNLGELEAISNSVLRENGFSYKASAMLSDTFFPTKSYDDFSLPPGKYRALRICLGKASGQNWWCVLFPPLCVSASSAETNDILDSTTLSKNEKKLITSDSVEYKFKFKVVEIFQNIIK